MFDFSLAELVLVVVVAVVFIGPKDLPVVIRTIAKGMRSARALGKELHAAFDELAQESGIKETAEGLKRDVTLIQGDDGKMYESYNMPFFEKPTPAQKPDDDERPT